MNMTSREHQLFKQYPLQGAARISVGEVPTPYHIYDGYGLFIGGTVDLAATRRLLSSESFTPVQTSGGHSLMGIWVCNFTDASLDPHHELQFSFFSSGPASGKISSHPLSLVTLMIQPDIRMLCHGLWNNTPRVVAYNRELLSLNAQPADSTIEQEADTLNFVFRDHESGRKILAGNFAKLQRVSLQASWDLIVSLGFSRLWEFTQQPWVNLKILNPSGVVLDRNAVAESFTKNDTNLVRYFDDQSDSLDFGDTSYRALNFKPQFVQYMKGFKFVYLQPT